MIARHREEWKGRVREKARARSPPLESGTEPGSDLGGEGQGEAAAGPGLALFPVAAEEVLETFKFQLDKFQASTGMRINLLIF